MSEQRLENTVIKIRQLIADYHAGRIVIPEFQREYVWKKRQAPKLVDSLYQGFPISSLLMWSGDPNIRARRKDPRPIRSEPINWLVDGQQRVITLSRCLSGEQDIDILFHVEKGEFSLPNAATRREATKWYRLADIWEDTQYRKLRQQLPETCAEEYEAKLDRVRRILDYEIPVVRMADHSFKNAVEAFARINTKGIKLNQTDIESAKIAAKHSGFIADEVVPFLKKQRDAGFTRLNVMHLFRVCAFIACPDGRSRTPLHELDTKDVENAWGKTKRAAEEALNLVRSELGLLNMDIFWSGALLVPIMALYATQAPRDRDAKAMAAWIAAAALLHRYSKSADTALDQDLKACRSTDPIGELLAKLRRDAGTISVSQENFSGALADKGGLLGTYVACHHQGLQDLFTKAKINLQSNIDRHHILPRGQFPENRRASADCVANIAFVCQSTNRSINASGPEVYLKAIPEEVRRSQCIPNDRSLWPIERATDFLRERRKLLAESFNDFLHQTLPGRHL